MSFSQALAATWSAESRFGADRGSAKLLPSDVQATQDNSRAFLILTDYLSLSRQLPTEPYRRTPDEPLLSLLLHLDGVHTTSISGIARAS